jgi:hypothetical protein
MFFRRVFDPVNGIESIVFIVTSTACLDVVNETEFEPVPSTPKLMLN